MLALRKVFDGEGLTLCDVAPPGPPAPDEVTIKVAATGICGSDLAIERWDGSYRKFMGAALPVTLGHETAGHVVAVGDEVVKIAIGDRVIIDPAVACGVCAECRGGDPVGCSDRRAVGMVRDGAFARLVNAPAAYVRALPDTVPLELGALVEPLAVGAHALSVADFAPGARVLVFGPGPIGQGAAVLARVLGAATVAVAGMRDAARLATLRAMGLTHVFDLADFDGTEGLRRCAGAGFDIVVDAAGAPSVLDHGLALLRPRGILAMAGMGEQPATFDTLRLVKNRLQIRGVSRVPPSAWETVLTAMAADPAAFAPLIGRRMRLSEAAEAFALCRGGAAAKVLLMPGDDA